MHAWAIKANYEQHDAKRPKVQLPLMIRWEQNRVLHMIPECSITKGVGRPPNPRTHPYTHPIQGKARPCLGSEQGHLSFVFTLSCSTNPNKALPESII